MANFLQLVQTFLLSILLDYCSIVTGTSTGIMHSKCGRVDTPLSIECDPGQIIYIRQTIISEFHEDPVSPCTLPDYNPYCHVFVNHTDVQYNGKQKSEHTFWKELLKDYGKNYGNCHGTSKSKVVQIFYQCFSTLSMHTICDNMDIKTSEGFITSPNFPLPVNKAYESCTCKISSFYPDEIQMTAIIINPTATGVWSLSLSGNRGLPHDIGKMVLTTTHLNYVNGQTMILNFFSMRDTRYEPVYMPTKPRGFWIKIHTTSGNSILKVRCYSSDTSGQMRESITSDAAYGIAGCIVAVFIIFLLSVAYFIHYWRKKLNCSIKDSSSTSTSQSKGCTNMALSIEESVNHNPPEVRRHDPIDCFLNDKNDFYFSKTSKDGKIRYNTLPHRKMRHYFDREHRYLSQRIIKAEVHRQASLRRCPSINLSSISVESCGLQTKDSKELPKDLEETIIANDQATDLDLTLGMFDFDVFSLAGATDLEIDV